MAALKYGKHSTLGKQIKQWLETPDGECPISPCSVVVNDQQYRRQHEDDIEPENRDDIYSGPEPDPEKGKDKGYGVTGPPGEGPYKNAWTHVDRKIQAFGGNNFTEEKDENGAWIPFHGFCKWDPIEHTYHRNNRAAKMLALRNTLGPEIPAEWSEVRCWQGIVSNKFVIIQFIARNYDEPPISEVTNAIYSSLFPVDELERIFVDNIQNDDTKDFITKELFSAKNGFTWPPRAANGGPSSVWKFEPDSEEYEGLLGTIIGRMVGFWMFGRYPRGTCKVPAIYLALSQSNGLEPTFIDILFEVTTTQPPNELPVPEKSGEEEMEWVAGDGGDSASDPAPGPALKEKPRPGVKPAFEPVPPPFKKPIEAATAAAGPVPRPAQDEPLQENQKKTRKRKAEEVDKGEKEEIDKRHGKTRPGKRRIR